MCIDEKCLAIHAAQASPAQPRLPVRVEHEYQRKGALNLFAAFDTRTAKSGDRHMSASDKRSLLGF